jgi:hypothetical protein
MMWETSTDASFLDTNIVTLDSTDSNDKRY